MATDGKTHRKVVNRELCEGPASEIAGVTKPVEADIEFSEEGRDAPVKKAPAAPSELESELPSATHIPLLSLCRLRAKEDPHW